jgi:glycosyltransferase involved in cell wall biosynthesis
LSRLLLFANTTWYLFNFRLALARAVRQRGHQVILASPRDEYAERLLVEGFEWHDFGFSRRGANPLVEFLTLARWTAFYRQLRPDLVHHFTIKPVLYGSLAGRAAGVPNIVNSVTGLGSAFLGEGWRGWFLRQSALGLYRLALRGRRTRVIFQNAGDQAAFVRMAAVDPRITRVISGSGVDLEVFRPVAEPSGEPVIVMVSRMLWDKGVGELVEAAGVLRERGRNFRVLLVGAPDPGNPSSIPETRLRAWREAGTVEWEGRRENVAGVYAASHIAVLPSYREGLPRTLIEAAAAGRPIVATDVPGCRDVVEDGVNGLLVPAQNALALANALDRLLASSGERRLMGARGREIAAAAFSNEKVIAETLAVYDELLGGAVSGGGGPA